MTSDQDQFCRRVSMSARRAVDFLESQRQAEDTFVRSCKAEPEVIGPAVAFVLGCHSLASALRQLGTPEMVTRVLADIVNGSGSTVQFIGESGMTAAVTVGGKCPRCGRTDSHDAAECGLEAHDTKH